MMLGYKKVVVRTLDGSRAQTRSGNSVFAILELEIGDKARIRSERTGQGWTQKVYDGNGHKIQSLIHRYIGKGKHRCSRAIVKRVVEYRGYDGLLSWRFRKDRHKLSSIYNRSFTYYVGKVVRPNKPFSMSMDHCESGIHFYRTLSEARNH